MSLPIEIQSIVDKCEAEGLGNIVVSLFAEYGPDYLETGSDWNGDTKKFNQLLEHFDYKMMQCEGGGEGEGEYCHSVIRIGNKFFKAEWSYYSYNGCDFDYIESTIKEVFPHEKTITVYE